MADKFDRYREALIVETNTIWPRELAPLDPAEQSRLEQTLHADPEPCTELEYVRVHTGFCRQITVTAQDLQRLCAAP
ncbi:MAG: hypothetical protein NTY19_33560 [Planctomycetota bacterium]|nr:hypothetical protein [Planctomycetota bacterium]